MIERYELLKRAAGQGGYGVVDQAWDRELERDIAIKTLDPIFKKAPSPEDIERFRREAKTLARLTHPNIPAIYDVVFNAEDGEFRLLVQWIPGMTLNEHLKSHGVLSIEQVKIWFESICYALKHAHDHGVIHRDIKPSNLIISEDKKSCYVVDFGVSLNRDQRERLTDGGPVGTSGYMSQEQERGEDVDQSTDIFSLGIVLYECIAGNKPAPGRYIPLSSINETVPPTIDELVKSCLLERNERIKSTTEFLSHLESALKPRGEFSIVLTKGSLADLQLSLAAMEPEQYESMPPGQKALIKSRFKDLSRVDDPRLRNPVASLLVELVRLMSFSTEVGYGGIIESALNYGYEVEYSDNWTGSASLRNILNEVVLSCSSVAHQCISERVLSHWPDIDVVADKEAWYVHDLRILLQHLLANDSCAGKIVTEIEEKLDQLNESTHVPRGA